MNSTSESAVKKILLICPVYNEQDNIDYFFRRFRETRDRLPAGYRVDLLFTNNRSTDGTFARLRELAAGCEGVYYLTLSRNHGYQLSVLSGLSAVEADLYMVCDVDCEDPPELLLEFLPRIEAGGDYVYGIRSDRPDPWLLRRMRHWFYTVLERLGDYKVVPYMSEFALFRREVRDVLVTGGNTFPFLRTEVGYAGFSIVGVPYRREARAHGASHYNYVGNFRFAVAGILSSTTFPLRALFYALPVAIALVAGFGGAFVAGWLAFEQAAVALLALQSVYTMGGLAFLGVYLARTYQNGLNRPRFVVDRRLSELPGDRGATLPLHEFPPARRQAS